MKKFSLSILFVVSVFVTEIVVAQSTTQYQIANRLMQQQRFLDAIPMLERLVEQQPEVYIYLELLVDCHIQLKQYHEALSIVEENQSKNLNVGLSNILKGELFHFMDDTAEAFRIWEHNLKVYPNEFQIYSNTATTMVERRAFDKAIEVYEQGRMFFNNPQIFTVDIANVYMQAGQYMEAIGEWLMFIEQNPNQESAFRRLLLRYNDPLLFDDSIAEVEFKISEMSISDPNYETFYQLQIWLQLENKLFRRAFATARAYERSTSRHNYALYNVGRQLKENGEFELALQAFDYYKDTTSGGIRWPALEETAETYSRWAKYLDDYSLDFSGKKDSLFQLSISYLDTIISETRNYERISRVYLRKAELSLDYIFDLEEVQRVIALLKQDPGMINSPDVNYLEGRAHIAKQEFTEARITLTRANRDAGVGDLAEKTRYFLALNDFYAGDYEFAQIQLKTLGRQNTSYYANDALELRLWVQEGLQADTTGASLDQFSEAHFSYRNGEPAKAEELFYAIIDSETPSPFKDDAYLLLPNVTEAVSSNYLNGMEQYAIGNSGLSQKELFLWKFATLNDEMHFRNAHIPYAGTNIPVDIPTMEEVIQNYENLILEFPQGFYAPYARQRLAELSSLNS